MAPDKEMSPLGNPNEGESKEGRLGEVINTAFPVCLQEHLQPHLLHFAGEIPPIILFDRERHPRVNYLKRLPQPLPYKGSAEYWVPVDDLLQGLLKKRGIQLAQEGAAELFDVDAGVWSIEAVKQEPLLERGQGVNIFDLPLPDEETVDRRLVEPAQGEVRGGIAAGLGRQTMANQSL